MSQSTAAVAKAKWQAIRDARMILVAVSVLVWVMGAAFNTLSAGALVTGCVAATFGAVAHALAVRGLLMAALTCSVAMLFVALLGNAYYIGTEPLLVWFVNGICSFSGVFGLCGFLPFIAPKGNH